MAMISFLIAVVVIMILCKEAKMQALISRLTLQKSVKATTAGQNTCSEYEYWIIITLLALILLGVIFLIIEKASRLKLFRRHQYSNVVKIMMFVFEHICICPY